MNEVGCGLTDYKSIVASAFDEVRNIFLLRSHRIVDIVFADAINKFLL